MEIRLVSGNEAKQAAHTFRIRELFSEERKHACVVCLSVLYCSLIFHHMNTHTPLCCLTAKTHCFIFLYLTVQQSIKCLLQRNAATHGFPSPPVCSEHLDVQIDVHVERHDLFICLADGALPLTYRLFYLCTPLFLSRPFLCLSAFASWRRLSCSCSPRRPSFVPKPWRSRRSGKIRMHWSAAYRREFCS